MAMRNTMKRGVRKRILTLLMVAASVPALFTAGLAFFEFNRTVRADAVDTLQGAAKAYGVEVFARLERAAQVIDVLRNVDGLNQASTQNRYAFLLEQFDAIGKLRSDGDYLQLRGEAIAPIDVTRVDPDFLAGSPAQLLIQREASKTRVVLASMTKDGEILLFQLKSDEIWSPIENALYATQFCVYGPARQRYFCSDETNAPTDPIEGMQSEPMTWLPAADDPQFGTSWQLFLGGAFAGPSLDVIAYQPVSFAQQSRASFAMVFWPSLALVLLLVAALTFKMASHSLTPLQRLIGAARQLAAGNFTARVDFRSGDEFESLGEAFNSMACRLGNQIATLEAMSEIDRLILSNLKLEDVAQNILEYVRKLTQVETAAVIARFPRTPYEAQMLSIFGDELVAETVPIPTEPGHKWCQPRQVSLLEVDDESAPYKLRFREYGQRFVLLIPVVLDDELKGVLLLGSANGIEMQKSSLKSCVDLAGRLAVALSSVEREEALYRKAHYDDLTGLPNRQLLSERLRIALRSARRNDTAGAMLFLDLDRFKEINDVYGHSVGDTVLAQAAERIVSQTRAEDTVARLGGDEFVIVMPGATQQEAADRANRLLGQLTDSFSAGGVDHFVAASIGIVLFPVDGDSVETLLKNADSAMYRAKEAGRGRFEFFSQELNAASHRKIGLERDLRTAFDEDSLELHYQPQFDIRTAALSGAEALLRWNHPTKGAVSPGEFVPLAEDTSLIVDMGRWAIRHACRDLRKILDLGLHPGPISINVSTRQLRDPNFEIDVLSPLRDYDVHPGYLQIEVTETTVAQNKENAINVLNKLRSHGVRIAIDDFGTGYSSLSYLQEMPFDHIKIDMSFIHQIGSDERSDNICRTIIRMAHELGKEVIAEGVENAGQLKFLLKHGCDYAQGYYHSEALSTDDFLEFVRKQDFHTQRRKALELVRA